MPYRCIIIDDEPLAIKVIEGYLSNIKSFEVIDTFNNPLEALELLQTETIDLMFLDINLPFINGIEFLRSLKKHPQVVLTTAYREYAVESYELNILDYLVKPIPIERFMKTINKANLVLGGKASTEDNREHIFIKMDKKMIKVFLDEILYVESLKDYIRITTIGGSHLIHQTLTSFTNQLPGDKFIRIHRSFTISIPKVSAISGNVVEIGDHHVPIGRNYVNEVKDIILK